MSGLPKQTLKVLLGGQQQDVVARLVPPGSSLVIENMFFDHQANLVKRYGSTALGSTTVPAGDTPPRSWALGKHQGALVRLGRQGQAPLMEWDPDHSKWLSAGSAQLVEGMLTSPGTHSLQAWGRGPTVTTIAKAAQQTTWGNHFDYHDIAVGQGFQCLTFVEGTDVSAAWTKLHQVLIDLSTGRQVMHVANGISNHIYFPHVAIVGTYACFVYNANGTLRIETFNLAAADPTVRVDNVSVAGEPTADHAIEIIVANNGLDLLIGYPGQSGQFRMATFRPANGITSTVNLKNQSSAAIGAGLCFAWAQNLDGAVWTNGIPSLVTADISAGFKAHTGWVQIDATNYAAGITQTVDGTDLPAGIAVCTAAGGTGSAVPLHAVYQSSNGTVPTIGHSLITNTGCTVDVNLLNARLVSKLFRDAGGATLYTAVTPFANQGTFYVMPVRDRPNLFPGTAALPAALCRAEVATAWQSKVNAHLPLPWVGTDGSVYVSVGVQYLAGATVVRSNLDIMRVQFRNGVETTLPAPVLGNPVEAIESMFVPGGQLNFWDGKVYGLAGFAYYPDAPVLTNNGASGAMTSVGGILLLRRLLLHRRPGPQVAFGAQRAGQDHHRTNHDGRAGEGAIPADRRPARRLHRDLPQHSRSEREAHAAAGGAAQRLRRRGQPVGDVRGHVRRHDDRVRRARLHDRRHQAERYDAWVQLHRHFRRAPVGHLGGRSASAVVHGRAHPAGRAGLRHGRRHVLLTKLRPGRPR
jgi:hypothetical protein